MEKGMTPTGRVYTAEAAKNIGVSKATLLRWLTEGKVPEVSRDVRDWRIFSNRDIQQIKKYANTIKNPRARR